MGEQKCTHTHTCTLQKSLFAVQAGGEAKQHGGRGSSQSSRVWDRGPDVSQGFSWGTGWNGKIIKRTGRREPRGKLGLDTQLSWKYLKERLCIPLTLTPLLPLCDSCAHKHRQKQLRRQLQFNIYELQRKLKWCHTWHSIQVSVFTAPLLHS